MPEALVSSVTEVVPVAPSAGPVVSEPEIPALRPLKISEDDFALAIIECGGNVREAYLSVFPGASNPRAKGLALLADPAIAGRIRVLQDAIQDQTLITLGSHLSEMATIRDMAKDQGQLKVALEAEKSRGVAAGLYIGTESKTPATPAAGATNILVQINTPHDASI